MSQNDGRQLAKRVQSVVLTGHEVVTSRLCDLLIPLEGEATASSKAVKRVCTEIPLFSLQGNYVSHQEFTDGIYLLLEKLCLDQDESIEVLDFFRGFCAEFFLMSPAQQSDLDDDYEELEGFTGVQAFNDSQPESAELARILATRAGFWHHVSIQKASELPVNFNDLLLVLREACSGGDLSRAIQREEIYEDPQVVYSIFERVIEALSSEERLDPSLLLDHYDSTRRHRRHAQIATATGLNLSLVDHCLATLAEFRRNYQLYLYQARTS